MARPFLDLTGKKFGKLTVILRDKSHNSPYWECACDCGDKTIASTYLLKKGTTKSCGCLNRATLSDDPLYSGRILYGIYKRACAKKRGYSFDLSFEKFFKLIQQNCYYCGDAPRFYKAKRAKNGSFFNGIDRLNNSLGYLKNNSVSCCKECNSSKMSLPMETFLGRIKKCYDHLHSTGQLYIR